MFAITVDAPGGPEQLKWREVADPEPGAHDVVIDVAATSVNRADILQRRGFYPPPPGAPETIGLECSGTVSAFGSEVNDFSLGDEVCALLAGGGYAEKVVVPAVQVMPKPAGIDLVTAGSIPEIACTVWSNLVMVAGLSAGETVLIHGGSGGIGSHAIQVAKAIGATVAVTAGSAEKLTFCADLGADIGVNYREADFVLAIDEATAGRGANVILDNMGAKYLARNVAALSSGGRLVVIGLQGGITGELNLGTLLAKRAAIHATSLRYRPLAEKQLICAEVVEHVWPMFAAGQVKPVIDRVLPIDEASSAHQRLESSEHLGKIILTVA